MGFLIFGKKKSLTIRKCVGEHITPYYRNKQLSNATSNMKANTPIPLPPAEITPSPITNMSVAPTPSNKNIESTVKKASQPLHMKKSYVQASKSNISCIKEIL